MNSRFILICYTTAYEFLLGISCLFKVLRGHSLVELIIICKIKEILTKHVQETYCKIIQHIMAYIQHFKLNTAGQFWSIYL